MTKAMEEARAIARYDPGLAGTREDRVGMFADDRGDWVKYEDHATALAARNAEIDRLREALTEIGEGRPPNPVGDPWSFYDDLAAFARRALTAGGQP